MPKSDGPAEGGRGAAVAEDQLVREGDIAGDYLERLLDVLDYDGDIDLDVEAGRAIVSIDGGDAWASVDPSTNSTIECTTEVG